MHTHKFSPPKTYCEKAPVLEYNAGLSLTHCMRSVKRTFVNFSVRLNFLSITHTVYSYFKFGEIGMNTNLSVVRAFSFVNVCLSDSYSLKFSVESSIPMTLADNRQSSLEYHIVIKFHKRDIDTCHSLLSVNSKLGARHNFKFKWPKLI